MSSIRFTAFAEILGPDGFPYFALYRSTDGGRLSVDAAQTLLERGCGLALFNNPSDMQPAFVYRCGELLCYSIFKALRPGGRFDETRYPDTLDKPVPAGTRIVEGQLSDVILPNCASNILKRLLSERCGRPITLNPRLFEMPGIDDLFRIKLNTGLGSLPMADRVLLDATLAWCLPYAAYL